MKTLEEIVERIRQEKQWVDVKPFSHNIISICLAEISSRFGYTQANKVIRQLRLKRLGWEEETVPPDECKECGQKKSAK